MPEGQSTIVSGKNRAEITWLVNREDAKKRLAELHWRDDLLLPRRISITQPKDIADLHREESRQKPTDPMNQLIEICARELAESGSHNLVSRNRLILLCGACGVGKTLTLWRLMADATALPGECILLDFEADLDYWMRDAKPRFKEGIPLLVEQAKSAALLLDGYKAPLILIVDGLDNAARHVSVELRRTAGIDKKATDYVKDTINECIKQLANVEATVVIALDVLPDNKQWKPCFDGLRDSHAVVAVMHELESAEVDEYVDSLGPHVVGKYEFLRLPVFLDSLRLIDGREFSRISSKLKCLELSQPKRAKGSWEHYLVKVAKKVGRFRNLLLLNQFGHEDFQELLSREWAGAWFELLEDEFRTDPAVATRMNELLETLRAEKHRWGLSSTFALSNVITALVEAKALPKVEDRPHIGQEFCFCNLQRANFNGAVFAGAQFVAADCREATFEDIVLRGTSRFVATDFTGCGSWKVEPPREDLSSIFVECLGKYPGSGPETKPDSPPS